MVVGLSAVEKGIATKPANLDITWRANDLVGSAREARSFILRTTLIFVSEELKEYATNILKYQKPNDALPTGGANRIRALSGFEQIEPDYLPIAPLIILHWRNRIVHPASNANLAKAERTVLLDNENAMYDAFKHIDVSRLLQDFDKGLPTLKDVTVLLAMSINFVRQIDSRFSVPANAEEVKRWLVAENLLEDVSRMEKEAAKGGNPDPRKRAKQFLMTKASSLADPYYTFGVGA
jgi:hypothetical protein